MGRKRGDRHWAKVSRTGTQICDSWYIGDVLYLHTTAATMWLIFHPFMNRTAPFLLIMQQIVQTDNASWPEGSMSKVSIYGILIQSGQVRNKKHCIWYFWGKKRFGHNTLNFNENFIRLMVTLSFKSILLWAFAAARKYSINREKNLKSSNLSSPNIIKVPRERPFYK